MRVTNKSLQKREQRMRRVRGEKRPSPNEQEEPEHDKPVNQQLWYRQMFQLTLFDLIPALQEGQPMRLEAIRKLDRWGVWVFVLLILQIVGGTYANTREKPLPRVAPGGTLVPAGKIKAMRPAFIAAIE
jgi:hypothetical protein